jgi:hypothetical protein
MEDTINRTRLEGAMPIAAYAMKWSVWISGLFFISAVLTGLLVSALWILVPQASASDAVVYSVYRGVDLGNPGEAPSKDYYVNLGTQQGVENGSILEVSRKLATYDLMSEKLYKEVVFPIATLKVIHAESGVAIARLDKMITQDQVPSFSPRAVMVGDLVRKSR